MLIQAGYELVFNCPQRTRYGVTRRLRELVQPHGAPMGRIRLKAGSSQRLGASGSIVAFCAPACPAGFAGRHFWSFCWVAGIAKTDLLTQSAWSRFGNSLPGWPRVQAICDFVYNHSGFNYQGARSTRTAWETFNERTGVYRDYAHLAVAFCRRMNIPERYCSGYLGDIRTPPLYGVMDFAVGLNPISVAAGTRSMQRTTCRGLDGCSSREAVTPPMSPSRPHSDFNTLESFQSRQTKSRKVYPIFDNSVGVARFVRPQSRTAA
jgi:hypothetical protein